MALLNASSKCIHAGWHRSDSDATSWGRYKGSSRVDVANDFYYHVAPIDFEQRVESKVKSTDFEWRMCAPQEGLPRFLDLLAARGT